MFSNGKTITGIILTIGLLLIAASLVCAATDTHVYRFTFDEPMSWADDVTPWADYKVQGWEIGEDTKGRSCLKITASTYQQPTSYEIRTLQFNHEPDTPVTIGFDVIRAHVPPGSFMMIRHFDGYCGGQVFHWAANDKKHPFPEPLWDSRDGMGAGWQKVARTTPKLKNTVVTFAFIVQQPPAQDGEGDPGHVGFWLDNLEVGVTPLKTLMDSDFDWHGNYGSSTNQFRRNTLAANADWCDFADQEIVETEKGDIRYTLFQFRDSSRQTFPGVRHNLFHDGHTDGAWGVSTIRLQRGYGAGNLSAVSWGVRQTVSYEALGLKPFEEAKIRVSMKMANMYDGQSVAKVQMGVDPYGQVVTRKAEWTGEDSVDIRTDPEGWHTHTIEFDRPKVSTAFTIYFRQRDGLPKDAKDDSYPPEPNEPQSQGSPGIESFADWVMVEVVK